MLRTSLVELQRLGVVALAALDECAVAAIVDALAIPGLQGVALAGPLLRHTGGNPLFVLETLKHGLTEGTLVRGELPRPLSVGALIERRLQRLSDPALTLARVAAIAGVDFSIELAESAIGVRAVQLASAWAELQDAQVLRDESFAHDLVSDAVLRSVPPVVARRVHGQCAQWLTAHDVEPARVAWHWRHGGMPAEAGRAFVAAALRAEAAARLQEKPRCMSRPRRPLPMLACKRNSSMRRSGGCDRFDQSKFDGAAMQECRALLDAARTDTQRLRAHSELVGLLTERGEPRAALEAGQVALTLARRLGDHRMAGAHRPAHGHGRVQPRASGGSGGAAGTAACLGRCAALAKNCACCGTANGAPHWVTPDGCAKRRPHSTLRSRLHAAWACATLRAACC